ncbi:MAG: hypothetical protein HN337_07085 [Deltaproteobacteria bacterium]|nr:hypothetical protein [Deltaproteobacteria bacterium]
MRNTMILLAIIPSIVFTMACGSGDTNTSPTVDISEIDGTTDVAVDSSFEYNFSAAINSTTVGTSSFFILPTALSSSANLSKGAYDDTVCNPSLRLDTTITCDTDSKCKLDPSSDLSPSTRYTICLSTDIQYGSQEAFEGFSATFTTAAALNACALTLSFAGPTEPSEFQGLGEDATICAMSSWREYFNDTSPGQAALFVSSNCSQHPDGSIDHPYCSIANALVGAAELYHREIIPELFIDPGDYTMNLTLKSVLASMKMRGLCSTTTSISPSNEDTPLITQEDSVSVALHIRGITLNAGSAATIAVSDGDIQLYQVEVVQGVENDCFDITGPQATLTGQYVAIGGLAIAPAITPSSIDGGSLVPPVGTHDIDKCITVENGGVLVMQDFIISDLSEIGILITGENSRATLTSGIVSSIMTDYVTGEFGYGISIEDGASATLNQVTLTENRGTNMLVDNEDSSVTITNSYIGEGESNAYLGQGLGLAVQRYATADITFSNFENNGNTGIMASSSAQVTVSDSSFTGNGFANMVITDANAILTQNSFGETVAEPGLGGGVGLFIQSRNSDVVTTAQISNNIITGSRGAGIYVIEYASGDMDLTIENNYIYHNATYDAQYNPHYLSHSVRGTMDLIGNCIVSGGAMSPAIRAHDSILSMQGNTIVGTYDQYTVHQQSCADPMADAVDLSAEVLPAFAINCICNTLSSTGEYCYNAPVGPTLNFHFGIEEVEAIQ